ncbi:MAG: hypothetical protein GWN07_26615, partial [Actinobacteria bacterium]|nr:hypothetical protein [Actinomycetota bacterium]NIS34194.1 hypothetical protein [Actinomycetota bacterium]NIT97300.1 hypothetical protein [Actinomycetota bacterium]NIU68971.1 hypothetical protein [Actinomycetota bacterium]NIV57497.1 hypothetical protein [Actinomycetota bacterium]
MRGLLALAGLTFVLSACAASEPSPPSSSPTTTIATTTSTPPPDTSTDRYLDALEDLLSETGFADSLDEADDLFVAVGERMCR